MNNIRIVAAKLYSIHTADRQWILKQLTPLLRKSLESEIKHFGTLSKNNTLKEMGVSFDDFLEQPKVEPEKTGLSTAQFNILNAMSPMMLMMFYRELAGFSLEGYLSAVSEDRRSHVESAFRDVEANAELPQKIKNVLQQVASELNAAGLAV